MKSPGTKLAIRAVGVGRGHRRGGLGRARPRSVAVPAPRVLARARGLRVDRRGDRASAAAQRLDVGLPARRAGRAARRWRRRRSSRTHSYGEYIFDWGWANAAERAGIAYYPKLVIAAPATPATGKRMLLAPGAEPRIVAALVAARAPGRRRRRVQLDPLAVLHATTEQRAARRITASSRAHDDAVPLEEPRLRDVRRLPRRAEVAQAQAAAQGARSARRPRSIRSTGLAATSLDRTRLDDLDRFYRNTTDNHGGRDYLRPGFFHELAEYLPDAMRMVEVTAGGKRIAGALFLETDQALYGRYWGADDARRPPALRDRVLHRHRARDRAQAAAVRGRRAGRAQARARLRAERDTTRRTGSATPGCPMQSRITARASTSR